MIYARVKIYITFVKFINFFKTPTLLILSFEILCIPFSVNFHLGNLNLSWNAP